MFFFLEDTVLLNCLSCFFLLLLLILTSDIKWQPTPVFLPGESHGRRSLVGYSPRVAESRTRLSDFTLLCLPKRLRSEKAMAPHSNALAWGIPWTEEPGGLQSMGSLGVGHDWVTSLSLFTFMHWRRKWQPTPVLLPG